MDKIIHFFDLDNTLWALESHARIIFKDKPNKPLIKLNNIETKNIINGIYKKEDNLIEYTGKMYWISDNMFDKIKKKYPKAELSDLGMSFIEYINPEFYTKIHILLENVRHLSGKSGFEIGIISARYDVENDKNLLVALKNELKNIGLEISKFYYISKFFKQRNTDNINYEKMKIIMENMVGFHIKDNYFLPIKQDKYNEIHFYDDEIQNINAVNDIQYHLEEYIKNCDDELYDKIIDRIKKTKPIIYTHLITNNKLNKFKTTKIEIKEPIKYSIKVDEKISTSFKNFLNKK